MKHAKQRTHSSDASSSGCSWSESELSEGSWLLHTSTAESKSLWEEARGGGEEDLRVRAANNGKLLSSADVYRVRCDDDVIATDVTLMGEVSGGFASTVLIVCGDQLLAATFFFSTLQFFCRSKLGSCFLSSSCSRSISFWVSILSSSCRCCLYLLDLLLTLTSLCCDSTSDQSEGNRK